MKRIMAYCVLLVLVGTVLAGCGKKITQPDDTQVQTSEYIIENTTEATTTEQEVRTFAQEYGVFLGVEEEDIIKRSETYHMIAVDGQGISKETVSRLHEDGHIVYAYLDIGSLEIYRDYYEQFRDLALGEYENWPDEYWVDVSDAGWQDYVVHVLAGDFNERGYDGLFLDNADVYYYYPKEEIYQGLVTILQGLRGYDMKLMINGADVFVSRLIGEKKGNLIDSVNQESVFSGIQDYEKDIFKETDAEDREYYMDYLDHVFRAGIEVYLLEYTKDPDVVEKIRVYCAEHRYQYYASPRVALL